MEFISKRYFFFVSHILIGTDGEFGMRAKYFYGMVRRGKCLIRVITVLDEGISLEHKFVVKLTFLEMKVLVAWVYERRARKKVLENIADRRFESGGLYYSCNVHYP